MGSVTLIRPDGSSLEVADSDAGVLRTLGYKDQTPEQSYSKAIERSAEEHYSTPGQQIATVAEGFGSGLTFGLTDLAFADKGSRERARHNPGKRLGAELIGSLVAPSGPLGRAAGSLAEGRVLSGALHGAAEGAQFGAGAAITNAQLSGDPLTVEGALAGMGWGAVFGGGIGAVAGKMGVKLEARAERVERVEREALDLALAEHKTAISPEMWHETTSAVSSARTMASKAVKDAESVLESAKLAHKEALRVSKLTSEADLGIVESSAATDVKKGTLAKGKAFESEINSAGQVPEVRVQLRNAQLALKDLKKASLKGDQELMVEHLKEYQEHLDEAARITKRPSPFAEAPELVKSTPTLTPEAQLDSTAEHAKIAKKAAQDYAHLALISKELSGFPTTAEGLHQLSKSKVDHLAAAIDKFNSIQGAEFLGTQEGLKTAINKLTEQMGFGMSESAGSQFRGAWETVKSGRGLKEARALAKGDSTLWDGVSRSAKQTAKYEAASWAGRAASGADRQGSAAYGAVKGLAYAMLSLKGAVMGKIAESVLKYGPKTVRGLQKVGPRIEPLYQRLDNTLDEKANRIEAMKARSEEIYSASTSIRDTLYKGISPIDREHPEFAQALHAQAVLQFQFLMDQLPRDPGRAISQLRSLWAPDSVAIEKFSRFYEVFLRPTEVIDRALTTHKMTPEAAEGLREMWPALYTEFRSQMLLQISNPTVWKDMGYQEQVNLALMLDLPVHSTMTPRFVAHQQQMYTDRKELVPITPRHGMNQGGGPKSGAEGTSTQTAPQRNQGH